MGSLEGRVAVVTGAGGGLGREHALLLAAEGAKVVVNDLGPAAQSVVDDIKATGGEAVASNDSVSDYDAARRLVATAVETFGDLHVVVNNAGILRDGLLVNMSEDDFDAVVAVHLKGTWAVSRHAAAYWREQAKAGARVDRSLINTTSTSGLHGNVGQSNYGAAKAGVATLTIVAADELRRYHVRANAVAPGARTAMTQSTPALADLVADKGEGFDTWHPGNVSPLIGLLARADCRFTGQVFRSFGSRVERYAGWTAADHVDRDERWTVAALDAATADFPAERVKVRTGADAHK